MRVNLTRPVAQRGRIVVWKASNRAANMQTMPAIKVKTRISAPVAGSWGRGAQMAFCALTADCILTRNNVSDCSHVERNRRIDGREVSNEFSKLARFVS